MIFPQVAAVSMLHIYHLKEIREIHLLRAFDPVLLLREAFLAKRFAARMGGARGVIIGVGGREGRFFVAACSTGNCRDARPVLMDVRSGAVEIVAVCVGGGSRRAGAGGGEGAVLGFFYCLVEKIISCC